MSDDPGTASIPDGGPDAQLEDAGLTPMDPERVPAGYPADLEQWVTVEGDRRIWLRPIIPDDSIRLAHAFAHADIDTIRRRFFTGAPPSDAEHLAYLATVDYVRRLALVAMDADGNSIGIGRFEATSDTDAEIAIVVAPAWRRRGVGAAILRALEAPARDRGITRFVAIYLPDNAAVERLLRSIGYADRRVVDGIAELTKILDRREPVASDANDETTPGER